MAKARIKIALEEWRIVELKRIAKERGTSVSAMMEVRMVEEMRKYEADSKPFDMSRAVLK